MDIEYNSVLESKNLHQTSSYYNSYNKLSEQAQTILGKNELVTAGGDPVLISQQLEKVTQLVVKGISKYNFMNDGVWMKIIIDREHYPEVSQVPIGQCQCTFQEDGFHLIIPVNPTLQYELRIDKTREKIEPINCKIYERKNKIYVALHKIKVEDWWTLKY